MTGAEPLGGGSHLWSVEASDRRGLEHSRAREFAEGGLAIMTDGSGHIPVRLRLLIEATQSTNSAVGGSHEGP